MRSLSGAILGKGIYLIGLGYPFIGRFPLAHMISAQFCKEQQQVYILIFFAEMWRMRQCNALYKIRKITTTFTQRQRVSATTCHSQLSPLIPLLLFPQTQIICPRVAHMHRDGIDPALAGAWAWEGAVLDLYLHQLKLFCCLHSMVVRVVGCCTIPYLSP